MTDDKEQQVDAILETIDRARSNLFKEFAEADNDGEDLSGQVIGAWRLTKQGARGGLATVYRAERADGGFEQTAAFKILRRGLDTDDLVRRFRAERQILSSLEHPAISKILDGGAMPDGRPFLVLEFIDGISITAYAEQHNLSPDARLGLITSVLDALQYAHRHLVVHRDVKPSNILVSAGGHVVLLDFGIAKILDPGAVPGESPLTRTGVSLLTPGYGSPEQHAGDAITTATDVFQVGLVMQELLSEPRGDLRAILGKALHSDPAQRYASAGEMRDDIERFRSGLPVAAQPDSMRYRLSTLMRRWPWALPFFAVAAFVSLAYVTTLYTYSKQLEKEQALSTATQQFLIDLFQSPDPLAPADPERGQRITVLEALALGQQRIDTELAEQPELQAAMLVTLSNVYKSLDQNDIALTLRQRAYSLEESLFGVDSTQVVRSLRAMGSLQGPGEGQVRAGKLLEQQLSLARKLYPPDHPEVGLSEVSLGIYLNQSGDVGTSRTLILDGVNKLNPDDPAHARTMIAGLLVSAEYYGMESPHEAMLAVERAIRIANQAFGEMSLQAALAKIRLASTLTTVKRFDESETVFRTTIPVLEQHLGADHSRTISALNNLGFLYSNAGNHAKAETIHRDLLARNLAKHGEQHRAVADSYQNLAASLHDQGRGDEAIPLHQRAYEIYKTVFNNQHYMISFPLMSIAKTELERGNTHIAEQAAREALGRIKETAAGSFLEGVATCLVGLALEQHGDVIPGQKLVNASHALLTSGNIPDPYPALCRLPDRS